MIKLKTLLFLICLLLIQPVCGLTTITDATELQNMNLNLAEDYELGNNIDASGTSGWNGGAGFIPIGTSASRFTGSFDGKNYTITGLTVNRASTQFTGLFGYSDTGSIISNVGIVDVDITGDSYAGGLVGHTTGFINNCYSTGSVSGSGTGYTGGLAGSMYSSSSISITNSHSNATVISTGNHVGGLAGECKHVYSSYATGDVTSTGTFVGGLVGYNRGVIEDSYATGNVDGGTNNEIGGFAGASYTSGSVIIRRSYATGDVTSSGDTIGGFIGNNPSGIEECYATGNVNGGNIVGGFAGLNTAWPYLRNSYSRGSVTGTDRVGGFVGRHSASSVLTNSYSTGLVTGSTRVGGFIGDNEWSVLGSGNYFDYETAGTVIIVGEGTDTGVTAGTTLQMTYPHDGAMYIGWDFATIWEEATLGENDGYVILRCATYTLPPTPTPTPTPTAVIAIPPTVLPTPLPTEPEPELEIVEEELEETNIFILVTEFLRKSAPFVIMIIGAYIGAFLTSLVIKDDDSKSDDPINVGNVLLYGTVGWIAAFLIDSFGVMNIVELTIILSFIMFMIFGIISYLVLTLLSNSVD